MVGTQEIMILCGIPGSGKSTWAVKMARYLESEGYTVAWISRDKVRFSMLHDNDEYFAKENAVFREFIRQINESIELGINVVIIDATHITVSSRTKLINRLVNNGQAEIVFKVFDPPLKVCMQRNSKRSGRERVPDDVMKSMDKNFQYPRVDEYDYPFERIRVEIEGSIL